MAHAEGDVLRGDLALRAPEPRVLGVLASRLLFLPLLQALEPPGLRHLPALVWLVCPRSNTDSNTDRGYVCIF